MTLTNIANMAYDLAVGHYINGEKFSEQRTRDLFGAMLRKEGDAYYGQIALPDGKWCFRASIICGTYDLYIPDTREQEDRLIAEFAKKSGASKQMCEQLFHC